MATKCPYCKGEHFQMEAKVKKAPSYNANKNSLNLDTVYENTCASCGEVSYYDEKTQRQRKNP